MGIFIEINFFYYPLPEGSLVEIIQLTVYFFPVSCKFLLYVRVILYRYDFILFLLLPQLSIQRVKLCVVCILGYAALPEHDVKAVHFGPDAFRVVFPAFLVRRMLDLVNLTLQLWVYMLQHITLNCRL